MHCVGFGRMCLHIQGNTIGDVREEHCSLFHAVTRINEVASMLATLRDGRFTGHTDQEIFAWLDAILYSGDIAPEQENLRRFDFLTNISESFDGAKAFIFCDSRNLVRILFQLDDNVVRSACCDMHEFMRISADLAQWFKQQTQ